VTFLYRDRPAGGRIAPAPTEPRAFHRALAGYAPTPLIASPSLAAELGIAELHVKLETDRLGLPSFKVMGASWATMEALGPVLPASWRPEHGFAGLAGALPALTLVAATEGNHGRAVARIAALLGLRARILVPDDVSDARVAPIAGEGAEVVRVDGTYDDAVAQSQADAQGDDHVLVSDTSWPGYERIPAAVVDGYSTILRELDDQLERTPDLVLAQLGVGSFGAAVIHHFHRDAGAGPRLMGVEPAAAACVMASLAADRIVTVPGPHESLMAGLNCGTPSLVAWSVLRAGLDGVIALRDEDALAGVRRFADEGVAVGECSGVALAAARELLAGPDAELHRARLALGPQSSVLLFATEGVTRGS
jgi:diaminopropionate ammonia-lyase